MMKKGKYRKDHGRAYDRLLCWLSGFLLLSPGIPAQTTGPGTAWQDEKVSSLNREPMHATYTVFPDTSGAVPGDWQRSPLYVSLNGPLKFNWVENPEAAPDDFFLPAFDDSGWDDFRIPATWEVNGYGYPIYVNQPYEFSHLMDPDPPHVPARYNPVGSYRKSIKIEDRFAGKEIFIRFGAVKSNLSLWVNGTFAGYSEDSKLPAEFNITPYVKPGDNLLAFRVFRWSDGSYLECQDMWRMSGIMRDSYLFARDPFHIRDFTLATDLDGQYRDAMLRMILDLSSPEKAPGYQLTLTLLDEAGNRVFNRAYPASDLGGALSIPVSRPYLWTAETPYLYRLLITLKDPAGRTTEVIPQWVGFREVCVRDGKFLVNGKPILIKGVNRHEMHPATGQTISREVMEEDVRLVKRYNINAIRTCHYPNDEYFYDLCDRYGIYVVDEANVESHGMGYDLHETLANRPSWCDAHTERCTRMVRRDRNHPCIVTWSLGNEAGNGYNMYQAYLALKALDTTRPVQYERAHADWRFHFEWNTDILCPMYPSPQGIAFYADSMEDHSRPFILCEYAHAMGNSLGGLREYWEVIRSRQPVVQGGFIWDMIDQALYKCNAEGDTVWAYGGDFGPEKVPSDQNFLCNGIFHPDRTPNPHAAEVKRVYQDFHTRLVDHGPRIEVFNERFFRASDNVRCDWEIMVDGRIMKKGSIHDLSIGPRSSREFMIPVNVPYGRGKEIFLNLSYRLARAEPLLPAGLEIASEQLALTEFRKRGAAITPDRPLKVETGELAVTLSYGQNILVVSRITGRITRYIIDGRQLLADSFDLRPNFWRPPTDNDYGARLPVRLRPAKAAADSQELAGFTVDLSDPALVRIRALYNLPQMLDARLTLDYAFNSRGELLVGAAFTANPEAVLPDQGETRYNLQKFGMQLAIPPEFSRIRYYGRGPGENYCDRNLATPVGRYDQVTDTQCFDYIRPQETGNKTDVRWFRLLDRSGKGIEVVADSLLNVTARPYLDGDLDEGETKAQGHLREIPKRGFTVLSVDLKQAGLGCIDSWGSWPLEKYRIPYGDYRYTFLIRPVR